MNDKMSLNYEFKLEFQTRLFEHALSYLTMILLIILLSIYKT